MKDKQNKLTIWYEGETKQSDYLIYEGETK